MRYLNVSRTSKRPTKGLTFLVPPLPKLALFAAKASTPVCVEQCAQKLRGRCLNSIVSPFGSFASFILLRLINLERCNKVISQHLSASRAIRASRASGVAILRAPKCTCAAKHSSVCAMRHCRKKKRSARRRRMNASTIEHCDASRHLSETAHAHSAKSRRRFVCRALRFLLLLLLAVLSARRGGGGAIFDFERLVVYRRCRTQSEHASNRLSAQTQTKRRVIICTAPATCACLMRSLHSLSSALRFQTEKVSSLNLVETTSPQISSPSPN